MKLIIKKDEILKKQRHIWTIKPYTKVFGKKKYNRLNFKNETKSQINHSKYSEQ